MQLGHERCHAVLVRFPGGVFQHFLDGAEAAVCAECPFFFGSRRPPFPVEREAVFSASIFWRRWVFLLNAIFEKYLDGSRQFGIEQFVVGRVGEVVREVVLLQHPAAEGQQA